MPTQLARGQVNTILNAATGTGHGTAYQVPLSQGNGTFGSYSTTFAWQVNVVGTFSGLSVNLEGSLDGVNWSALANNALVGGGLNVVSAAPVPFIRANVITFTGGTNVSLLLTVGDV